MQTRLIEAAIAGIGASITHLGETTTLVADTAQKSSDAIEGVQHGTNTVILAIARIGQVTDETASGAERVSNSVFAQAAEITLLSDNAALLMTLAGELHNAVGRFHVKDANSGTDIEPIQLRKYPRLRVRVPVGYAVDGDPTLYRGNSHDIGGNGLSSKTAERLSRMRP